MNFGISTLKKALGTLLIGVALLAGMSITTQAQRRHGPPRWARANGRRADRPYGRVISARRHARNEWRRDLRIHQRAERRVLNSRLRDSRRVYGNSPSWRYQRKQEREDLKRHQRREKQEFKQRWKGNRRH